MSGRRRKKKRVNRKSNQQYNRNQKQIQRNVKDRLFRYLFEKDRKALLDLYNALNKTEYRDSSQLEIVTIESAVYVVMKNDLAYIMSGTLSMYEHQSTYSPNLPDVFENKKVRADVELTVRMLNINYGHNKQLMEKCRILEEYSELVAITRDCMTVEKDIQTALNRAVNDCIEKGILKEFLLKNRAEVLGMLLEEFDAEKYERTIRGEGREEGEVKVNRLVWFRGK